MVYTKTCIFTFFYSQYLVLFTVVPRNMYSGNRHYTPSFTATLVSPGCAKRFHRRCRSGQPAQKRGPPHYSTTAVSRVGYRNS